MASTWESISARKKQEQQSRIPQAYILPATFKPGRNNVLDAPRKCDLLTAKELNITEAYDATALAAEIATGRLTSLQVTEAFCKRAAIAHQLVSGRVGSQ
jgi:amidase